jgi:Putative Flp pilus-assembly TadE/G-like
MPLPMSGVPATNVCVSSSDRPLLPDLSGASPVKTAVSPMAYLLHTSPLMGDHMHCAKRQDGAWPATLKQGSGAQSCARQDLSDERGAILVKFAIASLVLIGTTAWVVDFGMLMLSRNEVQTAADAGALAGATSLAFDSFTDRSATGPAKVAAQRFAVSNNVFSAAPDVNINTDVTFVPCPDDPNPPPIAETPCIRVDAYRNQARNNPIPMVFGQAVGLTEQGVRGTATAFAGDANASNCLRPWAIVDRWWEMPENRYSIATDTFDLAEGDYYVPGDPGPGTGYTIADYGKQLTMKSPSTGQGGNIISPGWFQSIDIPRTDTTNFGANTYKANIQSCGGYPSTYAGANTVCPDRINIGEEVYWAARGCYRVTTGNMVGPTRTGVQYILDQDLSAHWVGGEDGGIEGSLFPPGESPRIVPVGVLDVGHFMSQDPNGGWPVVRLANILGFFIEGTKSGEVWGRLVSIPGDSLTTGGNAPGSFLKVIMLVR